MSYRTRRIGRRLVGKFWFVPSLYVLLSLGFGFVLVRWDKNDPITLVESMNPASATAALSALASGMLVFTGFVTSVSMMVVQFGTSEFSPRFVAWLHRDETLKNALSTFTATFLFTLMATALVGAGTETFVPTRTLIAALLLTRECSGSSFGGRHAGHRPVDRDGVADRDVTERAGVELLERDALPVELVVVRVRGRCRPVGFVEHLREDVANARDRYSGRSGTSPEKPRSAHRVGTL